MPKKLRSNDKAPSRLPDGGNIDWSKQNVVLAEELGVRPNTISRWRREQGGGARARTHGKWRNPPKSKYDWDKVDWSKQDCAIADDLGTYSSTVAKWRRQLGKPQSPTFHKHRVHKARERYKNLNWKLQDIELAEKTGLTRERIRQLRIYFGAPKSPKHGVMRPRQPKKKAAK
ncbi:MAG: hypothetical protein L0Y58_16700 [Verrucomicrobia subdivision 3 bacterium]|nr:hypothetical protein [Limisphaerales bacterium]